MLLGLGSATVGVLILSSSAVAIETVELQYQDQQVTVSLDEIRTYAESGEASAELQAFIGDNAEIAELVGDLLVREITITEQFRERVQRDLQGSSFGQFLLLQVDKLITGSEDLTELQSAIQTSLADNNRISIVEILDNYSAPGGAMVNLSEAGVIYNDVQAFVERVLPALEVAKEYLQEVICECEAAPATGATESNESPVPAEVIDRESENPEEDTPDPETTPQSRQRFESPLASDPSCQATAALAETPTPDAKP